MAQDVVINGTTYPAVESVALMGANGNTQMYYPDAVRYVEQELTSEQQAQARQNIGVDDSNLFFVTVSEDMKPSHSAAEILEALQEGKHPVLDVANIILLTEWEAEENAVTFWGVTSTPTEEDGMAIGILRVTVKTKEEEVESYSEMLESGPGEKGEDGQRGTGILKVTTAPTSYTTATGGKNPIKRMSISTIKTQAGVDEVLVGDQISYSYYLYHIYYLDATYAYMDVSQSIRGAKGSTGDTGPQGPAYTLTETDKQEIAEAAAELVDVPEAGATDAVRYGAQTLTGEQQAQARENIDAVSKSEMFTTRQELTPDYTNLVPTSVDESGNIFNNCGWMAGKQIASDGSAVDNTTGCYVSGFIRVKPGDVVRVKDPNRNPFSDGIAFALYKESKATAAGIGKYITSIQTANNNDCGILTIDGSVVTWTLDPINYYNWKDFAWLRVTTFSADMIVTVNEPLTESVKEQLILKPTVKVTPDSLETDVGGKPLSGKTIVGFGDSIFGYVRDATSVLSVVANETGATVHNVGFGGCRMSVHPTNGYAAFSMWALAKAITENDWTTQDAQASSGSSYFPEQLTLLKSIDFNTVDIAIIHYGSNDFNAGGSGVAIDNPNDPDDYTTMCGALRYSVEKLLTAYPHLQIFVSLPTYFYKPDTGEYPETYLNAQGKYYDEYVTALRNTAVEYHLPVIDCYYGLGVNKLNVATMTSDGAHHSQIGRQRLGEFIAGHLSGRQNSGKGGLDTAAVQKMIDASIAAIPVYNGEVV